MNREILPTQIWQNNLTKWMYKVSSTTPNKVEMYLLLDLWDCEIVSKEELHKNYTFIDELI
jgi:hypothetical protein